MTFANAANDALTVASIALTTMSTVVAVAALLFSYRQNVGWKPVMLIYGSVLRSATIDEPRTFTLEVTAEFWNRRRYPVALRWLHAHVKGVTILDVSASELERRQYTRHGHFHEELSNTVDPAGRETVIISVSFRDQSLDALRPLFDIYFSYFDPYLNRSEQIRAEHKFFYPELGWKKSDVERGEAIRAYEQGLSASPDRAEGQPR